MSSQVVCLSRRLTGPRNDRITRLGHSVDAMAQDPLVKTLSRLPGDGVSMEGRSARRVEVLDGIRVCTLSVLVHAY